MCRIDMANFLALKRETASRVLSHRVEGGFIDVRRRDVTIRDTRALGRIASDAACGSGKRGSSASSPVRS